MRAGLQLPPLKFDACINCPDCAIFKGGTVLPLKEKSSSRASTVLGRVCIDLVKGPALTAKGEAGVLIFVDEASLNVFCDPLKSKAAAGSIFEKRVALVEREKQPLKVGVVRPDNAEVLSESLTDVFFPDLRFVSQLPPNIVGAKLSVGGEGLDSVPMKDEIPTPLVFDVPAAADEIEKKDEDALREFVVDFPGVPCVIPAVEEKHARLSARALDNIVNEHEGGCGSAFVVSHHFGPVPAGLVDAKKNQADYLAHWLPARKKEFQMIKDRKNYVVVRKERPKEARAIFKKKIELACPEFSNGGVLKFKVRLKNYDAFTKMMVQGIDYDERYASAEKSIAGCRC